MPRTARASIGDVCYHVLNRGNGRQRVFHSDADYAAFLDLLAAVQAVGHGLRPRVRVHAGCGHSGPERIDRGRDAPHG